MGRYWYLTLLIALPLVLQSCGSYLQLQELPKVNGTYNLYNFTVQNVDQNGQSNLKQLSVQYDGFDVVYQLNNALQMSFVIENKTNKSLIIDKSKSYVLTDGYSKELFKDVRSNRNTTFNNVQDAINNVQTNEGGQVITIPPYSKWKLPLEETNVGTIVFPSIIWEQGKHEFTQYTASMTIEFVIPYSYDYSLAKWETSRNRLFVGDVDVEKRLTTYTSSSIKTGWDGKTYYKMGFHDGDLQEYNAVQTHNNKVLADRNNLKMKYRFIGITCSVVALLATIGLLLIGID